MANYRRLKPATTEQSESRFLTMVWRTERVMQPSHRKICKRLAVLIALPLAPFWLLFAAANYPWIVAPDNNLSLVRGYEAASFAGVGLVVVSVASMLWAAGVFGQGGRVFAAILLGALALA